MPMFPNLPFPPFLIPLGCMLLMLTVGALFKVGPFARRGSEDRNEDSSRSGPSDPPPRSASEAADDVLGRLKRKYENGEISRDQYKSMIEEYYAVLADD